MHVKLSLPLVGMLCWQTAPGAVGVDWHAMLANLLGCSCLAHAGAVPHSGD